MYKQGERSPLQLMSKNGVQSSQRERKIKYKNKLIAVERGEGIQEEGVAVIYWGWRQWNYR